jgi:hypothetical protein
MLFARCFQNRKVRPPEQAGTLCFGVRRCRDEAEVRASAPPCWRMPDMRPSRPFAQPRRARLQLRMIRDDKARLLRPGSISRGLHRGYFAAVALPN